MQPQGGARNDGVRSWDVVVVGAGIIGLSVAYHSAAAGLKTVVYERTGVGAEASGVQPGGVRQQWSTDVNCTLARESFHFYRDLGEHLASRVKPVLDQCGYVFLAHSTAALDQLARSVRLQNAHDIPSRMLSPTDLEDLVQGLATDDVVGASYCPEDGYFDRPQSVVEAFAQGAVARGAELDISGVRSLRPSGGGWEIVLQSGRRTRSSNVVVAASYDTNALLASLGITLPITKVPKYLFFSDPIRERLLEPLIISQELHFASKHLADGRVLASDLTAAGDRAQREEAWRDHVRSVIDRLVPILQYVSFPLLIEGFYDSTPDSQGIVSEIGGFPGLWVTAGFSGHGFMIAPAIGRAMSELLHGRQAGAAVEELVAARFTSEALQAETQVV